MNNRNKQENKILLKIIFSIIIIVTIFFHGKAYAAYIYTESNDNISKGDTVVINVLLDTEGKQINSMDGNISMNYNNAGNFNIENISLADSSFNIWIRKPIADSKGNINFIGGVPGGINGKNFVIFKIAVKFNSTGNFTISPNKMNAYINDGLGTVVPITGNTSNINISPEQASVKNEWQNIVSSDKIPPESFIVDFGQDKNIFENKKYIFFQTTDKQSGIDHYEVREGSSQPIIADNYYVLNDQSGMTKITVYAYDKAGNVTISEYKPVSTNIVIFYCFVLVIALVLIIVFIFYKIRKLNNNEKK